MAFREWQVHVTCRQGMLTPSWHLILHVPLIKFMFAPLLFFFIFTFGLWIKRCLISPHVINNIIKKYLRSPFLIFAHQNCFHFVISHACFYNLTILNILGVIEQLVMSIRHIILYNYRSFKHVYWLILTQIYQINKEIFFYHFICEHRLLMVNKEKYEYSGQFY